MKHIAIIDFGSQYTHLIARNIREMNVLAKIYHTDLNLNEIKNDIYGVILSGGPQSVYGEDSLQISKELFNFGVPVLGICYGHQLMGHLLGGKVEAGDVREYGRANLKIHKKGDFFEGVSNETQVWMSHGDAVKELPDGFELLASTADCEITAMANFDKHFYGLQFHPEVEHSEEGDTMLRNFVLSICESRQDWKVENLVDDLIRDIRAKVADRKVFILASGGVDSNVAFVLLNKALGKDRVIGLYVDNGFMRLDESVQLKNRFESLGYDNLHMVDASETFLKNVEGVAEPEEKRKIIGQTFLEIKDQELERMDLNPQEWLLGQGTIYPDIIESGGTKNADKIKTHHNRVDAISELIEKGLVIEPLADFYKDEVRKIGKMLDLPVELVDRHPFPGPGLSIRCLCHERKDGEDLSLAKTVVSSFIDENFEGLNSKLLPVKSVGVQGDNRTYAHPVLLWGQGDWNFLDEASSRITNSLKEVNRALLWLNPHDEKEFDFLDGDLFLTKERLDVLREIDDIVMRNIREAGVYDDIWQFPVVLVPVSNCSDRESVVLRPIVSRDAMTLHFYPMGKDLLTKISEEILATGKVSNVFFDITNKPPGTTEWE